jgi:hypothetical protein
LACVWHSKAIDAAIALELALIIIQLITLVAAANAFEYGLNTLTCATDRQPFNRNYLLLACCE